MKIKVIWLITVVLSLSSVTSLADCPQHTTLYFVNGVDTKEGSAERSRVAIRNNVLRQGVSEECISFDVAYNTNEFLFLDFMEAGLQLAEEGNGQVKDYWKFFFRVAGETLTGVNPFDQLVIDYFWDTNLAVEAGQYILGDQLDEHLAIYRDKLAEGHKIILLGHSQGNLYVNEVWDELSIVEQASTSTIAVATPSDKVGSDVSPYTTLHNDWLAANLFSSWGALPTNTNMTENCEDKLFGFIPASWLCHGFKESYMLDSEPREKIINDILIALPDTEAGATIQGQVRTGSGESIESNIALYDADDQLIAYTTSDNNGYYSMLVPACLNCYLFADTGSGSLYFSGQADISVEQGEAYDVDLILYQLIPM